MLHCLFPCVSPPKTHENSLGCSTLENRKNRVKKVLPQKTPFFGLFWPFLSLFWTPWRTPLGPPKTPIFGQKRAFFGVFGQKHAVYETSLAPKNFDRKWKRGQKKTRGLETPPPPPPPFHLV